MKKILLVSEFSYLNTGYACYDRQLLNGLHQLGYDVYELACYGNENEFDHVQYSRKCPWKVFLNIPSNSKTESKAIFDKTQHALHGSWCFDSIMVDVKPDVVISLKDEWYFKYQSESPLIEYTNWVISPAVDASPQKGSWLDTFSKAQAITSYNGWSENILRTQLNDRINVVSHISPPIGKAFKVLDKRKAREAFSLPQDKKIFGSVMRNQGRKRFPEIFECVSKVKDIIYYVHTAYPDRGWDIPTLLAKYNIFDRVYFTYKCPECMFIKAGVFQGSNPTCNKCGGRMSMCTPKFGLQEEELAVLYNCFDLLIQPHNSEGFGIPVVEAAKCGVKSLSTDYSAQEDVIQKVGGIPIPVDHYDVDINMGCERAAFDKGFMIKMMKETDINYHREGIAKLANTYYDWSDSIQRWGNLIESLPDSKWDSPIKNIQISGFDGIKNLSNSAFIWTCAKFVANQQELIGSDKYLTLLDGMNDGYIVDGNKHMPVDKEFVYNYYLKLGKRKKYWENLRRERSGGTL